MSDATRADRSTGVLLVSCYELGHAPLAVATSAAFLNRSGFATATVDLSVETVDAALARARAALEGAPVRLIAVSVPMHTALHLAVRVIPRLRRFAPDAHVCLFGLYAVLNADHLFAERLADSVIGGEHEPALRDLADHLAANRTDAPPAGVSTPERRATGPLLERPDYVPPAREGLPGPERYARFERGGETRLAGAVEATRGCLHHCRHCPIPAVYSGRFFAVPREIVLRDVARLVDQGVRHVTFVDPDFLNGPTHAKRLARDLHATWGELTFDFTAKIEHLLKHRALLPELAEAGCAFVVSAVESLHPRVLDVLDKGHTADDVFEAVRITREAGIALRPSLMPFSPWETLESYGDLLDWIARDGLEGHVDPVQLSIRLLVPPGSLLADHPDARSHMGPLDAARFSHPWSHPDPRMDRLHREVEAIARDAARRGEDPVETHGRIRDAWTAIAGEALGTTAVGPAPTVGNPAFARSAPPRITEPWFC